MDGDKREASACEVWAMKVVFLDDGDGGGKEIEGADLQQLFQLADKLSDTELERLGRAIDEIQPQDCGGAGGKGEAAPQGDK